MNLPNLVSLARLSLGVMSAIIALASGKEAAQLCLWLFCASSLLDKADGFVARYTGSATIFGKNLDRVCDQLVVWTNLIALAANGVIAHWLVVAVIIRGVLVSEIWNYVELRGQTVHVYTWLHSRYLLQLLGIILGFACLVYHESIFFAVAANIAVLASIVVGFLTLVLTIRDQLNLIREQK